MIVGLSLTVVFNLASPPGSRGDSRCQAHSFAHGVSPPALAVELLLSPLGTDHCRRHRLPPAKWSENFSKVHMPYFVYK